MKSLEFSRFALSMGVAAALLAGCGGSQPPIGAPGAMLQSRAIATHAERGGSWMLPEASGMNLLYSATGSPGVVDVFAFPKGKLVGRLDNPGTIGMCSDANGDIWIISALSSAQLSEFLHGGTKPIATLSLPAVPAAPTCSVDPFSGNLAAAYDGNWIAVYPHAQGEPMTYRTDQAIHSVTYDSLGDLFSYGYNRGPSIAELPVGGSNFTEFALDEGKARLSFAQWDGQHVAAGALTGKIKTGDEVFWQLQVSTAGVTVVGTTTVRSYKSTGFSELGWIQSGTLIQPNRSGSTAAFYRYPKGGKPNSKVGQPHNKHLSAVTVSLAPRR